MDLSKLSDAELQALIDGGGAPDGSLPGDGSAGPMVLNVGPRAVADMSDHELRALANAPPEAGRGAMGTVAHEAGVGARAVAQGVVGGIAGLPALVADSVTGVGRDIAYGGKLALSKTGAVDPPDPKNYYSDGSSFPLSNLAAKAGAAAPDALGLPEPETAAERMGSAVVEGAASGLTGAGVGNALAKFGPMAVKGIGSFLGGEAGAQTAAGALGGAGSQGAAEAGANAEGQVGAGMTASLLPLLFKMKTGRITSGSEEGQRRIAGTVLRGQANDPAAAIANLDKAGDTRIPGFQHFGTAAAKDTGIATHAQTLRDFSNTYDGGRAAQVQASNNGIISDWFDRLGAEPGAPEATRATANGAAGAAIQDMKLGSLAPVDITRLIGDLGKETSLRNAGTRTASADAAAAMRDRLIEASKPVVDAKGQVIGYRINPERLHAARVDFAEAGRSAASAEGGKLGSVKYAKKLSKDINEKISGHLNDVTGGAYSDYLKEQRALRGTADRQEFMQDFANGSSVEGGKATTADGKRQFLTGGILRRMSESKVDKSLPSGSRTMSVDRLGQIDPMSRSFLEGAAEDLNNANFVNQQGLGSRGSSTSKQKEFKEQIQSNVERHRSLPSRAASSVMPVIAAGSQAITRGLGTAMGFAGRTAVNVGDAALKARVATDVQGVHSWLGRAEGNPAMMAELMRLDAINNPSLARLGANGAMRAGKYGAQGFLAGERTSRYR